MQARPLYCDARYRPPSARGAVRLQPFSRAHSNRRCTRALVPWARHVKFACALSADTAPEASPSSTPPQRLVGQQLWRSSRSLYFWPKARSLYDRPSFLEQYPCKDNQQYNVNSFLGRLDPHGGKYYVPPSKYGRFLSEYYDAFEAGYQLFLTENYHVQPFRLFMELDFDWDVPDAVVEDVLPGAVEAAIQTAQEFFKLPSRPFHVISMRTIHKVHLNFPYIITTELLSHICRDRVITACRQAVGERHKDLLDWERIVDFSHGSFRLLGSRKPKHIQRDPPWVSDKAYYKVSYKPVERDQFAWVPEKIRLNTIQWTSIFPTREQIRQFEQSPAFLDLIYQDLSADMARMEERVKRRQGINERELQGLAVPGSERVLSSYGDNSSSSSSSGFGAGLGVGLDGSNNGMHGGDGSDSSSSSSTGARHGDGSSASSSGVLGVGGESSKVGFIGAQEGSKRQATGICSTYSEASTSTDGGQGSAVTAEGDVNEDRWLSSAGASSSLAGTASASPAAVSAGDEEGGVNEDRRLSSAGASSSSAGTASAGSTAVLAGKSWSEGSAAPGAAPAAANGAAAGMLGYGSQEVKLTLKVMPWGEVKAWLRPSPSKQAELGRASMTTPPGSTREVKQARKQHALGIASSDPTVPEHQELLQLSSSLTDVHQQLLHVQPSVAHLMQFASERAEQASMQGGGKDQAHSNERDSSSSSSGVGSSRGGVTETGSGSANMGNLKGEQDGAGSSQSSACSVPAQNAAGRSKGGERGRGRQRKLPALSKFLEPEQQQQLRALKEQEKELQRVYAHLQGLTSALVEAVIARAEGDAS